MTLTRNAPVYWHRISHWLGFNLVKEVSVDEYDWVIRECVKCGKRYQAAPSMWPL